MDSHIGAEVLGLIYMKVGRILANTIWLLLLLLLLLPLLLLLLPADSVLTTGNALQTH